MQWEQIETKWVAMTRRVRANEAGLQVSAGSLSAVEAKTANSPAHIIRIDARSSRSDGIHPE